MRSIGTIYGEQSNAAFNDPARAALMREEKFKRQLAAIEAKGLLDVKQQEVANAGAKEVQGLKNTGDLGVQELKNTGDLQNTQLTGDIQAGLRESMITENLSKAGLNEKTGELYGAEARFKDLDSDIKARHGMDLAQGQVDQQGIINKVTGEKAVAMGLENQGQRAKLEGLVDPKNLTRPQLSELQSDALIKEGLQPVAPTPSTSVTSAVSAILSPANYLGRKAGIELSTATKDFFKKRKLTL